MVDPSKNPKDLNKREKAYQELRRLLVLQQIPAGQRLREAYWTKRLGVNRSALREALVRLEADGLIESGPKKGYFVPTWTPKDLLDALSVRIALESAAIETICQRGLNTPEKLKPLTDACDLLEGLVGKHYPLSSAEADSRFHEMLVRASLNPRLSNAYKQSPLPILSLEALAGQDGSDRDQAILNEHRALVHSLLTGDISKAKALLQQHLSHTPAAASGPPAKSDGPPR
jgi:DNA-binding GntR family transcriptional regulator